GLGHAPVLAQDQLGAAAADIDDERTLRGVWPADLHSEMDETRLLLTGDYFDRRLQRFRGLLQEFLLIAGVAQSTGADGSDTDHARAPILRRHLGEHVGAEIHRALAHAAGAEHTFAQARYLPRGGESFERRAPNDLRRQHSNRVTPYVD